MVEAPDLRAPDHVASQEDADQRALVVNPSLLLLYEPMEGIAPIIMQDLMKVIRNLASEGGMAIVIVEQHAKLALPVTQQALVLDRGRVVRYEAQRLAR